MPQIRITLLAYVFAIIFNLNPCLGQQFENNFEKLTTQNGLSQNDVIGLLQDSKGYIWIGTHDGLNKYDGYSVTNYRKEPGNIHSLKSSLINCIAEDSLGNIWVGHADEGVAMLNQNTGRFTHYRNTPSNPRLITNNQVKNLLVDNNGSIWFGTNNGLNKIIPVYKEDTFHIQTFQHNPSDYGSINNNNIGSLHEDILGNIWIGNDLGLSRYVHNTTGKVGQFIHYLSGPSEQVTSIQETKSSLIIASAGIFELPFEEINTTNPSFKTLTSTKAFQLLIYDEDYLWATSNNGVRIYSIKEGKTELINHFTHHWGNPISLSKNVTTCIIQDNSGIVWLGTNGGGVNIFKPNKRNFRHYLRNESNGSISYNKIRSIFEDQGRNLWIGTEGGGLNFLPSHKNKDYGNGFTRIDIINTPNMENNFYSIEEFRSANKNIMLFGTGFPRVFMSGEVKENSKLNFITGSNAIHPEGPSFSILVDNRNIVWVGTYGYGLYRYQLDNNGKVISSQNFRYEPNYEMGVSSNIIRSIVQDQDDNIWIGTGNGLNKLMPEEQLKTEPTFIKYFHDDNYVYSLSHDYIIPILVTSKGHIWVGTLGGGLNKVIKGDKPGNDQFLTYTTLDGLPNNSIKALLEDNDGYLWLSSNKGLTRFSPERLEFRNYGLSDGLQDMEFSELAAFKRSDGELLFGGVNGFNAFYPTEIESDSFNVDLAFGNLQIVNQDISVGDTLNNRVLLTSEINQMAKLQLKHHENSFSLGFSALHYVAPQQNQYAYKLDGFDDDWIYTSASNRTAKYTNLSSGNYNLKVKGTNSDGYWSKKELSLPIIISTPWYFTIWSISGYAIIFMTGLWFFRKYTIITNTRKNQFLMEHFEKEKEEELSQLKLRFFTNISHEFRTPLTLIIGFIERLKLHSASIPENDRQKYYQNIFRNSKTLLNLINQLMGFRKMEQGKMKLKVSYSDLTNYISLLGENFYEMANKKEINFNVHFKESVLTWFDPEIMERVIFNLLSNAFKFTPEKGTITVSINDDNDHVFVEVRDNGLGIPKEIQEHLFERFTNTNIEGENGSGIGLAFIKSLIEIHHGGIVYETKKDKGTTFKVTLPKNKDTFSAEEIMDDPESTEENENWLLPSKDEEKRIFKPSKNKEYTLLLVEDNEDILFFLEENFKDNYNIFKANEGHEALGICLDNSIDLVVSDIMMDGMNGFEFCEKLKSDDRINHIPIILLTAKDSSENKIKGYALGAEAYIAKPFALEELETRLNALLESKRKIVSKFRSNLELSPSEVGLTSIDEKFLNRVMKCIEQNISSSEFSVEMLAHECGLSQIHLNKKLKALVGNTANSFIRSNRMKRTVQLLKKNRYSITEIMYEVGFNDAKYFRDCFKKEFDMTPSEYQKQGNEAEP